MKTINQVRQNQQGSVLLAVLGYLFLSVGLVIAIMSVGSNHRKISVRQVNMEQAMFTAEAGVERGTRFVESNMVTLGSAPYTKTNLSGTVGSGVYTTIITRINTTTYSVTSTGNVSGVKRTVGLMRVYQPTYAEFALWSSDNGGLYFKDGEVFDGRVHADNKLYFDNSGGGPIFHKAVTSGASTYGGNISGIQFDEGFTYPSDQGTMADVDFNSSASTSLKNVATSAGLVLDGTSTITFNGSTVRITNTRKGWTNYTYTPGSEGMIYVRDATSGATDVAGTVYLPGGNVTGRLTIVTETDMYLRGHITYTTDPVANPSSTDALGLISRDDVWVDTSAPNNLVVDAAILAAGTSPSGGDGGFGVINYSSGSPRGNLNIYGGIVQDTRGAVGTFNSGNGNTTHGYTKNYSYDPRFVDNPPPYYPIISGKIEYSDWTESK